MGDPLTGLDEVHETHERDDAISLVFCGHTRDGFASANKGVGPEEVGLPMEEVMNPLTGEKMNI